MNENILPSNVHTITVDKRDGPNQGTTTLNGGCGLHRVYRPRYFVDPYETAAAILDSHSPVCPDNVGGAVGILG